MKLPIIHLTGLDDITRLLFGLRELGYAYQANAHDNGQDLSDLLSDILEDGPGPIEDWPVVYPVFTVLSRSKELDAKREDSVAWRLVVRGESGIYTRVNSIPHFLAYTMRYDRVMRAAEPAPAPLVAVDLNEPARLAEPVVAPAFVRWDMPADPLSDRMPSWEEGRESFRRIAGLAPSLDEDAEFLRRLITE